MRSIVLVLAAAIAATRSAGARAPVASPGVDAVADITNDTAVEIGEVTLTASRRQIIMAVRVRNGSQRTLLPPLRLEIEDVRSKLGDVKPDGRSLDLSGAMPRAGLRHAEATGEQSVVFELPGDDELHVDRGAGEILTMVFRVRGRLP